MRSTLLTAVALFVLFFSFGCGDDDDSNEPQTGGNGAIFVTVRFQGNIVPNTVITTIPATQEVITSGTGSAIINDVEPGIYQVCAFRANVGAATGVATVVANEADELSLTLDPSSIRGPMVNITSPQNFSLFDIDQSIVFDAFASDIVDAPESLTASWRSSIDGELAAGVPVGANGAISYTTDQLSIGVHQVVLSVLDTDGNVGEDSIQVEINDFIDPVAITSLEQQAMTIELTWDAADSQDFLRYEVQRTAQSNPNAFFTTLASIEDVSTTSFVDTDINLFNTYRYRIAVFSQDGIRILGPESSIEYTTELPDPLQITSLVNQTGAIEINWEPSNNPDFFQEYRVERETQFGSWQSIFVATNVDTLRYLDTNVELFTNYNYRITHVIANNLTATGDEASAELTVDFIPINGDIERMLVDPNRPFIYAVDRVNNNLHFINVDLNEVTKTIFVGSAPVDLDLHPNGDLLYIANFGSTEIAVVDLNEQEISSTFFVNTDQGTWDGNPYRIALLSATRLAFTSEDQWNNIKIVNASNGASITVANNSIYQPGLLVAPNGDLYASESGSTGSSIIRYNSQYQVVDESNSITNFENRDALITDDGEFIFYNRRKLLANNLQAVQGVFPDQIYAITSTGTIAVSNTRYFNANDFSIVGLLPLESRIMVFGNDDETLYIYHAASGRLVPWSITP